MAFQRDLWSGIFLRDAVPNFPCPRCKKGYLNLKDLTVEEPQYSKDAGSSEDWEPDWTKERFVALLHCQEPTCGEIVTVSGDTTIVDEVNDEHGWHLISALRPQYLFPSPPIIEVPKDVPEPVASELKLAFALYWADVAACANRLRVSVELLLDNFKVPHEHITAKGKLVTLDLNGRIAIFQKQDPDHAMTLTALRMIGNLGSHGADVKREAILDAFEIYEDCLAELYGRRKQRMQALKKKIIQSKGKY